MQVLPEHLPLSFCSLTLGKMQRMYYIYRDLQTRLPSCRVMLSVERAPG